MTEQKQQRGGAGPYYMSYEQLLSFYRSPACVAASVRFLATDQRLDTLQHMATAAEAAISAGSSSLRGLCVDAYDTSFPVQP